MTGVTAPRLALHWPAAAPGGPADDNPGAAPLWTPPRGACWDMGVRPGALWEAGVLGPGALWANPFFARMLLVLWVGPIPWGTANE